MKTEIKKALCPGCGRHWIFNWFYEGFRYKNGDVIESIKMTSNPNESNIIIKTKVFKCDCGKINAIMANSHNCGSYFSTIEEWEYIDWVTEINSAVSKDTFSNVYFSARKKWEDDQEDDQNEQSVCVPIDPIVIRRENGEWELVSGLLKPIEKVDVKVTLSEFHAWFWETYSSYYFVPDEEDIDEFVSAHQGN